MQRFLIKYATDPGFKEFIDTINNNDEILMDFAYSLYMEFGTNTTKEVAHLISPKMLNLDNLIKFFEEKGEFEKCQKLMEIKKKI